MKILRRIVLGIVLTMTGLMLAIVLYLAFADLSVYRSDIEEGIADATGFELSFGGDFDLDVGGQVTLTASSVTVGNPAFADSPQLASVDNLLVVIDTWSIISGPLDIERVEADGIRATLVENAGGAANWQASGPQSDPAEEADESEPPILRSLRIADIALTHQAGDAPVARVVLDSVTVERRVDATMSYTFGGSVEAAPVATGIAGNGVLDIGEIIQLGDTELTIDGVSVSHNGSVAPDGTISIELSASGEDLSTAAESFGAAGMPAQPFELFLGVAAAAERVSIEGLQLTLGDGQLAGEIDIELSPERPLITAAIESPRLDLRDPAGAEAATADDETETGTESAASSAAGEESAPERLFSDTPLATSALDAVDLDINVTIGTVLLADDTLSDVSLQVSLQDGSLAVEPFRFQSGDGGLEGSFRLAPDAGSHSLAVSAQAQNLRLGALAVEGQDRSTIPPLNLEFSLSGTGRSMQEIMAGANGALSGSQQGGQINLQAAGILFSDLVTSILRTLNPLAETATTTNLECGVYEVQIVDGLATVKELAIQSERLTIVSSGSISLESEEIDLTLRTKTREGFGVSLGGVVNSFLKVGGTLAAPSIGVDAAGSVTTTGAAVATGGLSVLARGLWDRVSAEADLCSTLESRSDEVDESE